MNEASASVASQETFFCSYNCGRKAAAVGLSYHKVEGLYLGSMWVFI